MIQRALIVKDFWAVQGIKRKIDYLCTDLNRNYGMFISDSVLLSYILFCVVKS